MNAYWLLLTVLASTALHASGPTTTIRTFEADELADGVRLWGSLSANGPSSGFYGQRFSFQEDVHLVSVSVYIVDHDKFNEDDATINFGVWQFDSRPQRQIFMSDDQPIDPIDVGAWKTFRFSEPLPLLAGSYVIGAGQRDIQGSVAFGNAAASDDIDNELWILKPYRLPNCPSTNENWAKPVDQLRKFECPGAADCGSVMMALEVTSNY